MRVVVLGKEAFLSFPFPVELFCHLLGYGRAGVIGVLKDGGDVTLCCRCYGLEAWDTIGTYALGNRIAEMFLTLAIGYWTAGGGC